MALSKIFVAPKNGQEGIKKIQKNVFFQKLYSKDGKNKFGDLWDHNCKNSFFLICGTGSGGGDGSMVTSQRERWVLL